jgi:RNA polymerase sigma-70 factor (ECF subfamily)
MDEGSLIRGIIGRRAYLLAYVRTIVADEHLAEDIFQEVFVLAMRKREEIEDDRLFAWLRAAARLQALEARERRRNGPATLDAATLDALEAEWDRTDLACAEEDLVALRECLDKLPGRSADLVRLRYAEGLKSGDIARRWNREPNAVYVMLSRVHRKLSECVTRARSLEAASG